MEDSLLITRTAGANGPLFQSAAPKYRAEVLAPSEYEAWDALVEISPHGTVFHTSWWLQATGSDFQILVCRSGAKLLAGVPVSRIRRRGVRLVQRPSLTPYLGPVFDSEHAGANVAALLSLMRSAGETLANAISDFDLFEYDVGPNAPDLQGFLWEGYRAELGYTFVIPACTTTAQALRAMSTKQRVRLSNRHGLAIERGTDFETFLAVQRKTFAHKRLDVPFSEDLARRLWAAANERNRASVYLARTAEGQVAAGLCVVYDPRCSYQLMAGTDRDLRALGAGPLLEWTAIQDALSVGRCYDFEGSVFRGVEVYFRSMGGVAVPIYTLTKTRTWRGALALRWLRRKYANPVC